MSWSHIKLLLYLDDGLKRDFYSEMCRLEGWSVRQLKERQDSLLYERTAISRKPEETVRKSLELRVVAANSQKHKSLYHLVGVVAAVALLLGSGLELAGSYRSSPVSTVETSPTTVPAQYGFTIQNISIGMSRELVERMFGAGEPESGGSFGYGKRWTETNPYDVERRELRIHYDDQNLVESVTGPSLQRNGLSVKPSGPEYKLEEFGPSDGVAVAVRSGGDFDSAVMLNYPRAGVLIEYYKEDRMWFTLVQPFED